MYTVSAFLTPENLLSANTVIVLPLALEMGLRGMCPYECPFLLVLTFELQQKEFTKIYFKTTKPSYAGGSGHYYEVKFSSETLSYQSDCDVLIFQTWIALCLFLFSLDRGI